MFHYFLAILSLCFTCGTQAMIFASQNPAALKASLSYVRSLEKSEAIVSVLMLDAENRVQGIGTGVLVDPWTVVTARHVVKHEKTESGVVCIGDYRNAQSVNAQSVKKAFFNQSFFKNGVSSDGKKLRSISGKSPAEIIYFADQMLTESLEKSQRDFSDLKEVMPDIAIIKLQTPLFPEGGFFELPTSLETETFRGLAVGYPRMVSLSNGCRLTNSEDEILYRIGISSEIQWDPKAQVFYSTHQGTPGPNSHGAQVDPEEENMMADMRLVCAQLKQGCALSGCPGPGMSGGPLLSRSSQDGKNLKLVGLCAQVVGLVPFRCKSIMGHIKSQLFDDARTQEILCEIKDVWSKKIFKSRPFYAVYQPLAPFAAWIKSHMGPTVN